MLEGMLAHRPSKSAAHPTVDQFMTLLPHTIVATATLDQAHEVMRKYTIRHLPVTRDGEIVGVVSLDDLHLLESLKDVDTATVPVEDAMTTDIYAVPSDEPLERVAETMAARKLGSVLIVDDGKLRGIFTAVDGLIALFHIWKKR
jgi:CBS domain-containing protein